MTATELFANQAQTTITSGGSTTPSPGTSESWIPAAPGAFPAADPTASPPTQFRITDPNAPSEKMIVTDSRTSTWAVTRGAEGTTPLSHSAGFAVDQVVTAGSLAAFAQGTSGGGGSGTVTSASVISANGFAGTVASATTTPAVTLSTTVTGLVKGNGTALSPAAAGTDYLAPGGSGAALTGITASQVGADASGAAAAAQAASLQKSSNLSDLASASTARTNLGLGTAAVLASSAVAQTASNLSDLASASTARTNLGLGTAATQASSAFDAAGAAAASVAYFQRVFAV